MSPREAVLALLEAMRAPAHVAVLSLAYKKKTGRAIKDDHKHGGMLNFIRTELKDEVLTLTLTLTPLPHRYEVLPQDVFSQLLIALEKSSLHAQVEF